MAEELDQSAEGTGTSAEAPASNGGAVDIDALVSMLEEKLNPRFSGLTTLIENKTSPLAQELSELKTAGMSPEEREQLEEQANQSHYERMERENMMLKMRQSDPDAVDFLMALDNAESFEDQLAIIKSKLGGKAADQVEAAVDSGEVATPAVDSTNPARTPATGIAGALATGQISSEAEADEILRLAGNQSLASIRRNQG